jgi:hypothetical protein
MTLILEDKWSRAALAIFAQSGGLTQSLIACLIQLVLSDTVLTVARALHVLAVLTEPGMADKVVVRYAICYLLFVVVLNVLHQERI